VLQGKGKKERNKKREKVLFAPSPLGRIEEY